MKISFRKYIDTIEPRRRIALIVVKTITNPLRKLLWFNV